MNTNLSHPFRNVNLTVFPCTPLKEPAIRTSWKTYTGPVETPIVGVAVPQDILIIDLDYYKGVSQAQVEQALRCRPGEINWQDAEIQTTQRGGKHYAFRINYDLIQGSNIFDIVGFDTRVGGRGYICTGQGYQSYGSGLLRLSIPQTLPELPQIAQEALLPRPQGVTIPSDRRPVAAPYDENKTRSMLSHIPPNCGRDEWMRVGISLRTMGAPFELFNAWSSGQLTGGEMPHNYDPLTIQFQYNSFKPQGNIGPATLRFYATKHGWKEDWSKVFQKNNKDPDALKRIAQEIIESGSDITQILSILEDIRTAPLDPISREAALAALKAELRAANLWTKQLGHAIEQAMSDGERPAAKKFTPLPDMGAFTGTAPARVVDGPVVLPQYCTINDIPIRTISSYSDMQAVNAMMLLTETFQSRLRVDQSGRFRFWEGNRWGLVRERDLIKVVWAALGHNRCKSEREAKQTVVALEHVVPNFSERRGNFPQHTIFTKEARLDIPQQKELNYETNLSDSLRALPHKPEQYNTTCLPVNYNPHATMKYFPHFLISLFGDQDDGEDRIRLLQEIFGYMLIEDTLNLQKAIAFEGASRGGKGVLIEVLQALLGEEQYGISDFSNLHKPKHQNTYCYHNRVFDSEAKAPPRANTREAISFFNKMVSGEKVSVERLYENETFETRIKCKYLIACNALPDIKDGSGSIANRFLILKFSKTFFGKEDRGLVDRLTQPEELEGILVWALDGLTRLLQNGGKFTEPESTTESLSDLRSQTQRYFNYIEERLVIKPGLRCFTMDIYEDYLAWALGAGESPVSLRNFSEGIRRELESRNVVKKKSLRIDDTVRNGFVGCMLRHKFADVFKKRY